MSSDLTKSVHTNAPKSEPKGHWSGKELTAISSVPAKCFGSFVLSVMSTKNITLEACITISRANG